MPHEVKQRRLEVLQDRINVFAAARNRELVGHTLRVLVERPARRGALLAGRTECNRWVNFEGPAALMGRFTEVLVTAALANSLRGRLLADAGQAA